MALRARVLCGTVAIAALLGLARASSAGVLDGLRAIDINDYAVGIGVSTTENIYVGSPDSRTVYPYLTKLLPSALDDGVTFSRDGAYGVRWLSNGGLEIGALAKLQTLGFEADDSELLAGLPERAWTVEVGPTLGWRGPVHVDWTMFMDLLRNHSGSNHLVRFSLPRSFPRGYLIPELGLHRYSEQFVDYYYGVSAGAALPERPAYDGQAANGVSLGLAWGFRMTRHWVLTGAVDLERFDSGITDSPIVDDEDQSRLTLQLSYDGDPFHAPKAAVQLPMSLNFAIAEIDADTAGASRDSLAYFDAGVRFRGGHRAIVGAVDATYSRTVGSGIATELRIRNLQLLYGYDLLDDRQKTLTVQGGLHFDRFSSEGDTLQVSSRSATPMPMLALDGAAHFASRFSLKAKLQLLLLDGENYAGRQMFASFGLFHRTFQSWSIGVGYVFNRVALTSGEAELAARIEPLHQGPSVLIAAAF